MKTSSNNLNHFFNIFPILLILIIISLVNNVDTNSDEEFCSANRKDNINPNCEKDKSLLLSRPRYILYDVNSPEGFNLRRDVYMRMAIFVKKLSPKEDWHLVLPPWPKLYHWQSEDITSQEQLPWSQFFDIKSFQSFAPVVEFHEFLKEIKSNIIEEVFVMQHYKDAFTSGEFIEKHNIESCNKELKYKEHEDGYSGWFWGFSNLRSKKVQCLSFHGFASRLINVLKNTSSNSVMFDHAEIALHENYGDKTYWKARRSMRFAAPLIREAKLFRKLKLNSTDRADKISRPDDWQNEKSGDTPLGGPYLAVHLRRNDFLWGRPNDVPSIEKAANIIRQTLNNLELNTVFVATDAPEKEFKQLKSELSEYYVIRFKANNEKRQLFKDGGLAIIDQIICSHARHFIGTHESTFSFRIQEEREILGFPSRSTFNRFCPDGKKKCSQPTKWKIVY